MHSRLLVAITLTMAFIACKNDPNSATGAQSANPNNLSGNWIAMDFCARAAQYGSVLQAENNAHRPYAFALVFNPAQPDSVLCFDGSKNWKLAAKINQDTIELQNAAPGKSVFLVYDSQGDKNISMFDGTGTSGAQMDKFIKSKAEAKDGYLAFVTALNHNLFSGTFSPLTKGPGEKVMFMPGGLIQGWKEFDRYQVCTGGACWVMGNEMDVIKLTHSKHEDSGQVFGFKYSAQNDTLSFLNLGDSTPDESGGYAVKGTAYKFLRKQLK
ncbi:MAG: hypothetical protein ABIQ93_04500 [Saprospiraceae bacterium]